MQIQQTTHVNTHFENWWMDFFQDTDYPATRLTLLMFAWHQFVLYARYLPYVICDHIPYFRQFKLQPDKTISDERWWYCFRHVMFYQFTVQFLMLCGFYPAAMALGMEFIQTPMPDWSEIAVSVLFFIVVEDFCQYFLHRALHWGPLYKHIHKMHHEFSSNFGLVAEYAHPLETLILGIGVFLGPLFWSCYYRLHVFTMGIWLAVRLIQAVDSHSGYDFPWSMHHYIPFWAGADFHDYHHAAFVGNYGSFFRIWDWLFGTSSAFYEKKERKCKEAKLK
ncbi:hypothetical protein BC833DRAFT_605239 [Globomyces pollinis-pini]|nr:hypothetical protein BC833DRAFT_605239 [Globomyces pollinis-pini]